MGLAVPSLAGDGTPRNFTCLSIILTELSSSIQWCKWAGIRRVFYWDEDEKRFSCLKVGATQSQDCYETMTDVRLVSLYSSQSRCQHSFGTFGFRVLGPEKPSNSENYIRPVVESCSVCPSRALISEPFP